MIDFKKIYEKIVEEDAVVAATDAGAGEVVSDGGTVDTDIAPNKGISADDVLGKCDHHSDGYLGTKCFHVPKNALGKGKMLRRWQELPGTLRKKKKKTAYEQGMKTMTESEEMFSEDDIYDVIIRYYGLDAESLGKLIAIVNLAGTDRNFLKFKSNYNGSQMRTYFIEVLIKDGKLAPLQGRRSVMTAPAVQKIFAEEAKKLGNSKPEINVIWGNL